VLKVQKVTVMIDRTETTHLGCLLRYTQRLWLQNLSAEQWWLF